MEVGTYASLCVASVLTSNRLIGVVTDAITVSLRASASSAIFVVFITHSSYCQYTVS